MKKEELPRASGENSGRGESARGRTAPFPVAKNGLHRPPAEGQTPDTSTGIQEGGDGGVL